METVRRFFKPPRGSFFLFGPRGTGKSTWLGTNFPEALRIDLLEPATYRRFKARPERLLELARGSSEVRHVIVDEIQRVPELLPAVHALIEELRDTSFVLTGSSARKLRRDADNLLGGRAVLRSMHPFMAAELGDQFNLDLALHHGLVPLVVASDDPPDTLAGYSTLYLKEEVQAEGLVRNVGDFARFLEAVSFSHSSLLNITAVARECEVQRKTVEGYLGILEDLLLGFRLPVFSRRARRAVVKHPKFYLFDTGIYRSLRPSGPLDQPEEIGGAALEGLVAQHLRAWNDYSDCRNSLFFWRTRSGTEVDFVVYGPQEFVAIEVKNSDRIRPADLKGLRTFLDDWPEARALFLYRGTDRLLKDRVLCMPVDRFLTNLTPGTAACANPARSTCITPTSRLPC